MLDALRRRLGDYTWHPVNIGHSDTEVWRLQAEPGHGADLYLKTGPESEHPDPGFHLDAEAARCDWLRGQGMPAPEVVDCGSQNGTEWLVTTAVPGRSAAEPWPASQRTAVVEAMADFARELHTLPVADCPFRRDPDTAVPDAEQAVALGLVDVEDFDEHRVGTDPETLLAELRRTRPAAEIIDPVVAHGDYCVPNVLIDPKTMRVSGIIDLGRLGIADRHQDLALAHRSLRDDGLNEQYGPAFAEHFLNHYGLAADPARMEWHELLDEFC